MDLKALLILVGLLSPLCSLSAQTTEPDLDKTSAEFNQSIICYDYLVQVRLFLAELPNDKDATLRQTGNAAAAQMNSLIEGDGWKYYFRESAALCAAVETERLSELVESYRKLSEAHQAPSGPLFDSWMIDMRLLLLAPNRESLLKNRTRATYLGLLTFAAWLASEGSSPEAENQRKMFTEALQPVKSVFQETFRVAGSELDARAPGVAAAFGLKSSAESKWKEFRDWLSAEPGNRE